MALKFSVPPAHTLIPVQEAMRRLPELRAEGAGAPGAVIVPAVPHEVFEMRLDDFGKGSGLDAARSVGWRYLLYRGADVFAAAETSNEIPSGKGIAQINTGPFAAATHTAIESANAARDLSGYTMRLLRIPALYVVALWLHNDTGGANIIMPLAPAPPPLHAGQRYEWSDVLGILGERARRKLREEEQSPPSVRS